MKLTHNSIKKLVFGAYRVEKVEGGYTAFYHFTEEQVQVLKKRDNFFYERAYLSSSCTIEFITDAKLVSFDYRFRANHSQDSIDIYVNGELVKVFKTQNLTPKGKISFELNGEKNKVVIYFPIDSEVNVKNLEIQGSYKSLSKRKKVLWIGDSITQGYGSEMGSYNYVNVANRQLNYDVLNQGIGGYWYDEEIIQKMEGYSPEKIIVAFGTNQYRSLDYYERIEKFYKNVSTVYPNVPVLTISPIWRGDGDHDANKLYETNKVLEQIVSKYPQVTFVDGFTLVPHVSEMFMDNLHPNVLGCKTYAENLVKAIKNLKF